MQECPSYDLVAYVTTNPGDTAVQRHLETCPACAEEVDELWLLLQPLQREVAAAYGAARLDTLLGTAAWPPSAWSPDAVVAADRAALQALPLPWLGEDISPAGAFARPTLYLGARFVQPRGRGPGGARGRFMAVTAPARELFLPLNATVQGYYTVHDDCHVFVVHQDAQGTMQLLWPPAQAPSTFCQAGTMFALTVHGQHGERQHLDLVATPEQCLPARRPLEDAARMAGMCRDALAYVRTLPPAQWALVPLPYTVVDPARVAAYRALPPDALAAPCLAELQDERDTAKAACAEVCHRLFACPSSAWDADLLQLFQAITHRLVERVVRHLRADDLRGLRDKEAQQLVRNVVDGVYSELSTTARTTMFRDKFLRTCHLQDHSTFTCFSYLALLEYLRTIALRHAFPERHEERREERKACLPSLREGLPQLERDLQAALQAWAGQHVLRNEVEQAIFASVLRGEKTRSMQRRNPLLLRPLVEHLPEEKVNKTLHNLRDATVWRVYKGVMHHGEPELQNALKDLMVRY